MSDGAAGREPVWGHAGGVLATSLARMASILYSEAILEDVLQVVVELACATVPQAEAASLTVWRHGAVETAYHSDKATRALDEAQYEAGDGPSVQALRDGEVVHAGSGLDHWPALAERARGMGIRSVLCTPLPAGGEVLAVLNLYSRAREFDQESRGLNDLFAAPAAAAVANVKAYAAASQLNENLREAIATREIIGEAKGILMARQACTTDEAFDILRRASQRTNRKLRDIAVDVVRTSDRKQLRAD